MTTAQENVILGSQSPQRLHLLQKLLPVERIVVVPPQISDEAGFNGLMQREPILHQLREIARSKCDDVSAQVEASPFACIVTADTVVIANDGEQLKVLGKPDGPNWQSTVRDWLTRLYSSSSHEVVTAGWCQFADGTRELFEESTRVHFKTVTHQLADWYIASEEPLGKAGRYGIQSAGSLFVDAIEGSLSNVIGLPLEPLWNLFKQRGVI